MDTTGLISPYKNLFEKYGQQYGVMPWLLERMAWTESRFNPKAKSGAGALGLMQFMKPTAQQYGVTDRTNVEQSIKGAAEYMHHLMQRFHNNPLLAVAAYNAGEGTVSKIGDNLKKLPAETQSYLSQILPELSPFGAPHSISGKPVQTPWGYHPGAAILGNLPKVGDQVNGHTVAQKNNVPGIVGGGNLPGSTNIGGQGKLSGIDGLLQQFIKPPVQEVANTLEGHDTAINRAVGKPFKSMVDTVNDKAHNVVNNVEGTVAGDPTWENNLLRNLIEPAVTGANNKLSELISPPVQNTRIAMGNGVKAINHALDAVVGGASNAVPTANAEALAATPAQQAKPQDYGLSNLSFFKNLNQQQQQQAVQAIANIVKSGQAAAAQAQAKAKQVANAVAGDMSTPASATPMPAGQTPQQPAQMPQPQAHATSAAIPEDQATQDIPLTPEEAAKYMNLPVVRNAPPASMRKAMGLGELPTLSTQQAAQLYQQTHGQNTADATMGALNKLMNFYSGVSHEVNDQGAGIRQMFQAFVGDQKAADQTAAARSRANDAFNITHPNDTAATLGADTLKGQEALTGAYAVGKPILGVGSALLHGAGQMSGPDWLKLLGMIYAGHGVSSALGDIASKGLGTP